MKFIRRGHLFGKRGKRKGFRLRGSLRLRKNRLPIEYDSKIERNRAFPNDEEIICTFPIESKTFSMVTLYQYDADSFWREKVSGSVEMTPRKKSWKCPLCRLGAEFHTQGYSGLKCTLP